MFAHDLDLAEVGDSDRWEFNTHRVPVLWEHVVPMGEVSLRPHFSITYGLIRICHAMKCVIVEHANMRMNEW